MLEGRSVSASVTLPAPASDAMVWLKPARLSVPPAATVNALDGANVLAEPAASVTQEPAR